MDWLKNKLREWLGVSSLEAENRLLRQTIQTQSSRITKRIKELDKLTEIDVDVGLRGPCTIILSGVFRGRGYIKFYEMPIDEFEHYVRHMRCEERDNLIRHVDAPPAIMGAFEL